MTSQYDNFSIGGRSGRSSRIDSFLRRRDRRVKRVKGSERCLQTRYFVLSVRKIIVGRLLSVYLDVPQEIQAREMRFIAVIRRNWCLNWSARFWMEWMVGKNKWIGVRCWDSIFIGWNEYCTRCQCLVSLEDKLGPGLTIWVAYSYLELYRCFVREVNGKWENTLTREFV